MDGVQLLDPTVNKLIFYKVRDYEVWDDTRDFFDKKLRVKSAGYIFDRKDSGSRNPGQLHCNAAILNNPKQNSCTPFMTMVVSSGGEKEVTVRTYPKFFGTLGEIGGTAELLFLFIGLIYFQYNAYYLKKYIKSEVLRIESAAGLRRYFPLKKVEKAYGKVHPSGYRSPHYESNGKGHQAMANQDDISGVFDSSLKQSSVNQHRQKTNFKINNEKSSQNVEELIDKQIEKNMSGISLWRSLNHLEILMKIFFRARHKKLLPVVLLNLLNKNTKNHNETKTHNQNGKNNDFSIDQDDQELTMDEAYDQITKNQPETEIEKIMDDFFIEHAPEYFQTHQSAKSSKRPPLQSTTKGNGIKVINMVLSESEEAQLKEPQPSELGKQDQFDFETIHMEERYPKTRELERGHENLRASENLGNSFKSSMKSISVGMTLEAAILGQKQGVPSPKKRSLKLLKSHRRVGRGSQMNKRRSQFVKQKKLRNPILEGKKILSTKGLIQSHHSRKNSSPNKVSNKPPDY